MSRKRRERREIRSAILLVAPFLIVFSLFFLYPTARVIALSFTDAPLIGDGNWIGFGNYIKLFNDRLFYTSLWNNIYFALLTVVPTTAIALMIATFAFAILFMFSAMTFGMQIAQSVVTEKESRIVEILAEAVPIRQLLIGKVVGNSLLALSQVVLIVAGHALGVLVTHDIALRTAPSGAKVHLPLLAVMVVFTVGGLLLMFGG